MTTEEYLNEIKEKVTILINTNGGYFIVGHDTHFKIGTRHFFRYSQFGEAIPFVIIAPSNNEEADKDVQTLKLVGKSNYKYYYRAMVD